MYLDESQPSNGIIGRVNKGTVYKGGGRVCVGKPRINVAASRARENKELLPPLGWKEWRRSSYWNPEGAVAGGEGSSTGLDFQENTALVLITVRQEGRKGGGGNTPTSLPSRPPVFSLCFPLAEPSRKSECKGSWEM